MHPAHQAPSWARRSPHTAPQHLSCLGRAVLRATSKSLRLPHRILKQVRHLYG